MKYDYLDKNGEKKFLEKNEKTDWFQIQLGGLYCSQEFTKELKEELVKKGAKVSAVYFNKTAHEMFPTLY